MSYRAERLARLHEIEEEHFWFVGRGALVERMLDRFADPGGRLLDVGCGSGRSTERLARGRPLAIGLDLLRDGLVRLRARSSSASPVQGRAEQLPIRDGGVDIVLLLDVLEHTDDGLVLREVHRVLRPGGAVIITVPAMPRLWAYRDVAAGHRRRYTREALERSLAAASLEKQHLRYYYVLFFPLLLISRLVRGGRSGRDAEDFPPRLVNRMLARVALLEAKLHWRLPAPFGSSIVAVARRA
jgi:ubiquinone/menaquinone biosynthesis C-methylase UbiE